MRNDNVASMKDQFFSTANQAFDASLFWRGNLAKSVKKKDFKGTIWGVGTLSFFLFLYVWLHMQAVKLSYEVQGLKTERQHLTNEYYYLKYKMYDVTSLPHVESVAREKLGMVTPRTDQVVILDDEATLRPRWFTFWENTMAKAEVKK